MNFFREGDNLNADVSLSRHIDDLDANFEASFMHE